MFYGLLATFFESYSSIFRKKASDLSKVSNTTFSFLGRMGTPILMVIFFMFLGFFDYSIFEEPLLIGILLGITLLDILLTILVNYLYKTEKISNIIPYNSLDKVFIIIFGFILFSNTSPNSFIITIITLIVVIIFSIDFKKINFPKTFPLIFFIKILGAINTLIGAYIITKTTSITYFIFISIFGVFLFLSYMAHKGLLKELKLGTKEFYINRFGASLFTDIGFLATLFLIKEEGIVLTTLLGFLGIIMTMIFSYIKLKDIPTKKNIILSIIVFSLVSVGYYIR